MTILKGKTALVTGSTSGIGKAIAALFAQNGATVLITGRDEKRGKAAAQEIKNSGGTAHFIQADLSDAASTNRLAQEIQSKFGDVDILVNNAGIFSFAPSDAVDEKAF